MNYISELSSICESVFKSNRVLTEKKDDENPFADNDNEEKKDEGSTEDETKDNDTSDPDNSDNSDDSNDSDDSDNSGFDGSVFGGTSTGDDTENEDSPGTEDNAIDDSGSDAVEEGGVSDEEYGDAADLGIMLLMLATQVHFWHINCRSSGDHNCLGDLYNTLIDETDKLLENIVSVTKNSIVAGDEQSFDFGNLDFDKEESISILEDAREEVDELVGRYGDNQGLCNIIGNISECLGKAIYMLSRFES